ncbi:putative disease resistance protein At3g14460 [Neltuma alba]|uniref:putative disease resistance protein At3g14460 n=1 Tax=Neltuma alba TaxID=207710 RepID=UPI0010A3E070|nr:putative disease resistance protein At3g14460 [Prosopis alba]
MAEGFVQQYSELEIESDNCFNELLSRSFIHQHEDHPEKFIMHDLIIDLAKLVSGNICIWFEGDEIPTTTARHVSYPKQGYDGSEMFKSFYHLSSLRTFLPQQTWPFIESCVLSKKVSHDLLPKLTRLRVLSLSMYSNITELPDSIGNLKHLWYLDLSYTKITRLPDATFKLCNLQTLLLSYCKSFSELPKSIEKLVNLRHLDITGTALKEMPTQITKLQNLHSLSTFVVSKQSDGLRIKELRKLPHLEGKLSILKLQNVVDPMDAFEAKLKRREKIEELVLEWDSDDSQDSPTVKNILNMFHPSAKLQRLTINRYGGTSFPNWVGDSSFTNITFLCVSNCKGCLSLPPFGQLPSLKELSIQGMASVKIVGHEFYCNQAGSSSFHPFPSLEILKFEDMRLGSNGGHHLKLKGDMPDNLPSLRKVDILNCSHLEAKSSALKWIACIQKLNINQGEKDLLRAIENFSLDSLKRLRITDCSSLQSLSRMISACHCLQKLYLKSIPSLESLPIHGLPTSLQRLRIEDCSKLEFPPQESWQNYTRIEFLLIKNSCDSLTFFPLGSFPKLKILVVEGCHNLETFTQVDGSSPTLESLVLSDCKQFRSMSQVQSESLTTLKYFSLSQLPNLESLPECGLPSTLRSFVIVDCERLSSVPLKKWGFQELTYLSGLQVKGDGSEKTLCNLLKYQLLPTSLVRIDICDFSNLKFLYGKGLRHLTCLEELYISECPELEFLPEDELPSSLWSSIS